MRVRKREAAAVLLAMALSWPVMAQKQKPAAEATVVDSGSFGIFLRGRRVGTEKFQIQQQADSSVATSEVTVEDGQSKAVQSSELRLSPGGEVRRYTWRELSPGKAESVVEPANEFLVQHISAGPGEKAQDQPYILPVSTVILDDYFFSQRELLTWRYLAGACKYGETECKLTRAQFPVLVPRQRTSLTVSLDYGGPEKVKVGGAERELDRFNLQAEGVDWVLWLDQNHKLVRIVIAAEGIEIVRD